MKEKEWRCKSFLMCASFVTDTRAAAAAGTITDNIYHLHNGTTQIRKFGKIWPGEERCQKACLNHRLIIIAGIKADQRKDQELNKGHNVNVIQVPLSGTEPLTSQATLANWIINSKSGLFYSKQFPRNNIISQRTSELLALCRSFPVCQKIRSIWTPSFNPFY